MARSNHRKMVKRLTGFRIPVRTGWWTPERSLLAAVSAATSPFALPAYPVLDVAFDGGLALSFVEPGAVDALV
eukprot:5804797-Prymnesium_polylepis.1